MFAALYLPSLPGRSTSEARARLLTVAREFSPRVERRRDDLLTLDVSGLGRWFDGPRALGEALRHTTADRGLPAHVAVAATRAAALLLALGRAGLTVALPGEEAARLASLPLAVLTAWTPVDCSPTPRTKKPGPDDAVPVATLRRWGLKTLGDLAALPTIELSERLGQGGVKWQRLARGEDPQPLVPAAPDERFEESLELEWPIDQLQPLSFVLGRLFEPLCARLERADRGAAVLHVWLDLVGHERFARRLQLPAPIRDARTLRTLVLLDLESNPPPAAIDRVTVAADVVEGRVLQFSLLARALPTERLSTLLARLSALMGVDRVGSPALVDSHRPGAFAMAPFEAGRAPAAVATSEGHPSAAAATGSPTRLAVTPGSQDYGGRVGGPALGTPPAGACSPRGGGAPRELNEEQQASGANCEQCRPRALNKQTAAGRIVNAEIAKAAEVAETSTLKKPFASIVSSASLALNDPATDHRPLTTAIVRRLRRPVPIRVDVQHGHPLYVRSDRRNLRGGCVELCAGPWRTSGAWWATGPRLRPTPSANEGGVSKHGVGLARSTSHKDVQWDRDEWEVRLRDGTIYAVFRDRQRDGWFIDAILD